MEHSKEFEALVLEIMPNIREISVAETVTKTELSKAILIDVREDNEWEAGHAKGAIHIGRGVIERDIVWQFPDKNTAMILYCGGGYRSALATENLQKMGYKNVLSMAGGWTAWKEMENENIEAVREHTKELAMKYIERGDATGWFEALYAEADGDNEKIPWADLEPNRFLVQWAESVNLRGNERTALVVGCGLGDDAKFLEDLGFQVTAFDVSPKAIEWAKKIHSKSKIEFFAEDLFDTRVKWKNAFEFVLEVYTIQALPLNLREKTIDAISRFVAQNGELVVVTRGRENDEIAEELPWALSYNDLSRFESNGLTQMNLTEMLGDEEEPIKRFVVEYKKSV